MRKKHRKRNRRNKKLIKKRRLKRKVKKILILFLFLILCVFIYYISAIFKVSNNVVLNVYDEYSNDIKVTSFFVDVTDNVYVDGKYNNEKIGEYQLTYKYKTIFGFVKSKKVKISVVDTEKPVIELIGSSKVEVFLDDEYKELGYKVSDNYDSDLQVLVEGNVDTSKIGSYYLVYKAIDSSNNKVEVVRKVVVERKSPLTLGLVEFNLDNYFEGTILKKSGKMPDDYLNKMVFAGDSVPWHFGLNYVFSPDRVWAKPCEGPFNFDSQQVYVNNILTKYTLADLIKNKKPEYLTLHMGVCDINQDNVLKFVDAYENVIDYIRENSPDTKLIVMSLMPQTQEYLSWISLRNNVKINKYNYYLAELCYNKGVKFLNASSIVKDNRGMGDPSLFFDDGYHPNVKGMKEILNYMNNYGYKE